MGLDLTLLPIDVESPSIAYSHTMLACDGSEGLYRALLDAEVDRGTPVPAPFQTYTARTRDRPDPHYGDTQGTPYGEPLRCLTAGELCAIGAAHRLDGRNVAVWAYLAARDPATRVACYWH